MELEKKQQKFLEQLENYISPNYTNLNFGYRKYLFTIVESKEIPGLDGKVDFSSGVIKINGSDLESSVSRIRETIYHEIIHVILDLLGYGEPEDEGKLEVYNEDLTTAISRGWMMFENLNPEFHDMMKEMRIFDD